MKKQIRLYALVLALILCLAMPAAAQQSVYQLGDKVADFSVTTPEGETLTLNGLLDQYDGVLINFWYDGCVWCDYEFPFLQEAYEIHGDDVAVLAVSPFDSDESVAAYKEKLGLTFPMASDNAGLKQLFGVSGYPTTVMIDRFGVMCYFHSGALTAADEFIGLMEGFVGEAYTESKVDYEIPAPKPDVEMPDPALMAEAAGAGLTWSAVEDGVTWPWLTGEEGERSYVCSSNVDKRDSRAELNVQVNAAAGDVLAFDLKVSSEMVYDRFELLVDGSRVKTFTGEMDWFSYAHAFDVEGAYEVTFAYTKDSIGSSGSDAAYLDNVRVLSGEEAAAALASNPVRPNTLEGEDYAMDVFDEAARRVTIVDTEGNAQTRYVSMPCDGFYLLPDQTTVNLRVQLGDALDADACVLTAGKSAGLLGHCYTKEDGYYITMDIGSMATTGDFHTPVVFYSDMLDIDCISSCIVLFTTEDEIDIFCESYGQYIGRTLGWRYEEADAAEASAPAEAPALKAASGEVEYAVTFTDDSGAPVVGVLANVCSDSACVVVTSDEAGRAVFTAEPYAYELHILSAPEGYAADPEAVWTFSADGGELTVVLSTAE